MPRARAAVLNRPAERILAAVGQLAAPESAAILQPSKAFSTSPAPDALSFFRRHLVLLPVAESAPVLYVFA